MHRSPLYAHYRKALSVDDISSILNCATEENKEVQYNNIIKRTRHTFYDINNSIKNKLIDIIIHANSEFKLDLFDPVIFERFSLNFYSPRDNDHIKLHHDVFLLNEQLKLGQQRKVSIVCLLNDQFTGADFRIHDFDTHNIKLKKGDVLIFPSFVLHDVHPLESESLDSRCTLSTWIMGPPFR